MSNLSVEQPVSRAASLSTRVTQTSRSQPSPSPLTVGSRGKRKRRSDSEPTTTQVIVDVSDTLKPFVENKAARSRPTMDQFDHFGCMIAARLRNLPAPRMQFSAMMKIQETLGQIEFPPAS